MRAVSRQDSNSFPLNLVCSTKFGVSSKISDEQVWNMFISDDFMVNYAGYKKKLSISGTAKGRGGYVSNSGGFMLLVLDERVFIVDKYFKYDYIGSLQTFSGDVFIEENNASQIAICDKQHIYIYDYENDTFGIATTTFRPIYIAFQNGYFISIASDSYEWRLSALNNGHSWPDDAINIGEFEEGDDHPLAVVPIPSVKGQLLIFGSNKTVCFFDNPNAQLFPYQRNNSFGIDYGCVNPATIDYNDRFIVWLGGNKKSGLAIMYTTGGLPQQISNDGINLKLEELNNPSACSGFLFKQNGHIFYQLSFIDPRDNFTLAYDFNTQKFFYISDNNQNYHPAKKMIYFDNDSYFLSHNDGHLYQMDSKFCYYDGKEVPRIIITPTFRTKNTMPFIVKNLYFLIEQGDKQELYNTDPLIFKGYINTSSDFPNASSPIVGDMYEVQTPVIDNNPSKTNTGLSFAPCKIVWNGLIWEIVRDITPRVDLCLSSTGGKTYGNYVSRWLNKTGHRKNIVNYWNLGRFNELCCQFRFYGLSDFIVNNGEVNVYT